MNVAGTGHAPSRREVEAVVYGLVPEWRGMGISRVQYLPGGYTNRNFTIEVAEGRYALRVVERGAPRPWEQRYLAAAAAPEVVAYDARRGHMLTRWIDGPCLDAAPPDPEEAGTYLADLHRQIPSGVRRYDFAVEVSAMLRQGRERGHADAAVEACFQRLDWRPVQLRGCHNDLNPWNVIRQSACAGRFRTLDWELAGDNDPLFDLVGLCFGLGWGLAEATACAVAYEKGGLAIHATPARLRDTLTAFHIREYAWAVAQLAAGNEREEVRAQADAMRRTLTGMD